MKEIEVKFLEIDKENIISQLRELGAEDLGEEPLKETIFYDNERNWIRERRLLRMRSQGDTHMLAYKSHESKKKLESGINEVLEYETQIEKPESIKAILEILKITPHREQEKLRHSFTLGEINFDIDTWPGVPAYLEIEAPDEKTVQKYAQKLGFNWNEVVFDNAATILKEKYNIPVLTYTKFTFEEQG